MQRAPGSLLTHSLSLLIVVILFLGQPTQQRKFFDGKLNNELQPGQVIAFFWFDFGHYLVQDSFPEEYRQKLRKLDYPYTLIRECDLLIEQCEKAVNKKFLASKKPTDKTDLCRTCYWYQYGGATADLDYEVNYTKHLQLIKEHDNFFSSFNGAIDSFYVYFKQPKSPLLFQVLNRWDQTLYTLGEPPHNIIKSRIFLLPPDDEHHKRINTWHVKYILQRQWKEITFVVILGILGLYGIWLWKCRSRFEKRMYDQVQREDK